MDRLKYSLVQQRLLKLGFNPGPVDGVLGRMTINAIKKFQASKDLVVDGVVGPETFHAMFGKTAPGTLPVYDLYPWFSLATSMFDTQEVAGDGNNPEIMKMAEALKLDYSGDDIPWCGLAVAHWIGSTLPEEPLPIAPLGARNWAKFGIPCDPQLASVLVFWRGRKDGWKGHVGLYFGEDSSSFYVLGGNQSNKINVVRIPRGRLIEARWPVTALSATGEKVEWKTSAEFSTSEA